MTIVCATSTIAPEDETVVAAAALARSFHHRLVLTSVIQELHAREFDWGGEGRVLRQLRAAELVLHADHTNAESQVLHGALDATLAQLCDEVRARMLVVGVSSRKSSGWHTTKVDRMAFAVRVPMLVVRESAPFVEWAAGREPLRVLIHEGERAWLGELGSLTLDEVVGDVWATERELQRQGLVAIESDGSADWLVEEAERKNVDLIIVGTHRERGLAGLLESVAHDVVARAPSAVALVPEPDVGPFSYNDVRAQVE
jgi:nucleotide-binding universal stress UspA family protein